MRNVLDFVGFFDKSNTVRKEMFSDDFGALNWSVPDWIQQEVFCDEILNGNFYDSQERKDKYKEMRSLCVEAFYLIDQSDYDTLGEMVEAEIQELIN